MNRTATTILSMAIAICSTASVTSLVADQEDTPDSLRRAILLAANERHEAAKAAFDMQTIDLLSYYCALSDLKTAGYECAGTADEKVAVLKAHLERMRLLYERIHALAVIGAQGGEREKESAAELWLLQAKLQLLQERK